MKYNFRNYIVLQQLRVHGRNTAPMLHALTSPQAITAPTNTPLSAVHFIGPPSAGWAVRQSPTTRQHWAAHVYAADIAHNEDSWIQ
jgi:hypothetical protein